MPFYQADRALQLSFLLKFKEDGEKMTLNFQNPLKSVRSTDAGSYELKPWSYFLDKVSKKSE